ncbi:MAG: methionine--tRNA ligase subunit beta [Promethearchaeota archaeon]
MIIELEDFKKVDLRVGMVKNCEKIPNSRRLYKLMVDLGERSLRQIITGIAPFYEQNALIGQKIIVLTNLKPKKFMGYESQGMLLAVDVNGEPFLLKVDERGKNIPPGSQVK